MMAFFNVILKPFIVLKDKWKLGGGAGRLGPLPPLSPPTKKNLAVPFKFSEISLEVEFRKASAFQA